MLDLLNRPSRASSNRKPMQIILNTLARQSAATPAEVAAVRRAVLEGRDVPERAMDVIVDRLMKELSW